VTPAVGTIFESGNIQQTFKDGVRSCFTIPEQGKKTLRRAPSYGVTMVHETCRRGSPI